MKRCQQWDRTVPCCRDAEFTYTRNGKNKRNVCEVHLNILKRHLGEHETLKVEVIEDERK